MTSLSFKWDGSDLGEIAPCIAKLDYEGTDVIGIVIKSLKTIRFRIYKYEDDIPLIADELKPIFGIAKTGRHKASIYNTKVILCKSLTSEDCTKYKSGEVNLTEVKETLGKEFFKDNLINEIRKSFVFRWILGLKANSEKTVVLTFRPTGLITSGIYRETDISLATEEKNREQTRILKYVMKDWFDNTYENVRKTLEEMIDERSTGELRDKIDKVLERFDPKYIWWAGTIARRIQDRI